jgi:hypothetical protein
MIPRSRPSRIGLTAILAATMFVAAGCGGSEEESTAEKRLAGFARSIDAAYRCMPEKVRARYDRRANRLEEIGAAILAQDRDRTPEEQDRALRGNREYVRLTRDASRLLARYLPRGSEHDAACYRRESERHDRRGKGEG